MKYLALGMLAISLLTAACYAQEPAATQSSTTQAASLQSPDRSAINATLQAYEKAYVFKKIDDLVKVWPDLPNQKKDYKKVQSQFDDVNISGLQIAIQPLETQSVGDSAVVQAQRTLQYVKSETSSESVSGDLRGRGIVGTQDQGPLVKTTKKDVKKDDKVWIKLHKNGDTWIIASISDKPQVP
jgi:Tfp pilus assembly protein PilV